ncbi:MAG TPA: hypothetical protein VFD90_10095 [Gaiellales bacterium]|jgi:hypothetical protein|nr:hypothetical protein [Gaiellales bacterium]
MNAPTLFATAAMLYSAPGWNSCYNHTSYVSGSYVDYDFTSYGFCL